MFLGGLAFCSVSGSNVARGACLLNFQFVWAVIALNLAWSYLTHALQWQDTAASLRRELKKVKAKADESRELYDRSVQRVHPHFRGGGVIRLFDQLNQEVTFRS